MQMAAVLTSDVTMVKYFEYLLVQQQAQLNNINMHKNIKKRLTAEQASIYQWGKLRRLKERVILMLFLYWSQITETSIIEYQQPIHWIYLSSMQHPYHILTPQKYNELLHSFGQDLHTRSHTSFYNLMLWKVFSDSYDRQSYNSESSHVICIILLKKLWGLLMVIQIWFASW